MNKYSIYILIYLFGFFTAFWLYKSEKNSNTYEDTQIVIQSNKNVSKRVVSVSLFSENTYKDAKKYFYDMFEFNKSAIVTANVNVIVMFDLNKMIVEIDSIEKQKF